MFIAPLLATFVSRAHWELRESTGVLVDAAHKHEDRDSYRLHRIIDESIVRFSIDPPRSFTLYFDNGLQLTVFDESPQYESFSIQLDGKPTVYV